MKEIAGGAWLAGLFAIVIGSTIGAVVLGIIGLLAVAAGLEAERQAAQQAESWRKSYPKYRY